MGTLTNIVIWGNPRLEHFLSGLAVDRSCCEAANCSYSRALSVVSTYDRLSKKFISLFAALWEAESREPRFPHDQELDDAIREESLPEDPSPCCSASVWSRLEPPGHR